ncbi:MAG TPA: hypothetical protein VML55_02310, partial [Planctomycetaceae bacterium]|nr:hypothetical protein [Planctomycetaceae bacterium]
SLHGLHHIIREDVVKRKTSNFGRLRRIVRIPRAADPVVPDASDRQCRGAARNPRELQVMARLPGAGQFQTNPLRDLAAAFV